MLFLKRTIYIYISSRLSIGMQNRWTHYVWRFIHVCSCNAVHIISNHTNNVSLHQRFYVSFEWKSRSIKYENAPNYLTTNQSCRDRGLSKFDDRVSFQPKSNRMTCLLLQLLCPLSKKSFCLKEADPIDSQQTLSISALHFRSGLGTMPLRVNEVCDEYFIKTWCIKYKHINFP